MFELDQLRNFNFFGSADLKLQKQISKVKFSFQKVEITLY